MDRDAQIGLDGLVVSPVSLKLEGHRFNTGWVMGIFLPVNIPS